MLSFLLDLCAQLGYVQAAGPACERIVEAHAAAMLSRGVKLTFFDKSGQYTYRTATKAGWSWMQVTGFFMDVVTPAVAPAGAASMEHQVMVPAGTKAGAVLEFPNAATGQTIRAVVPEGFEEGGVMTVRA